LLARGRGRGRFSGAATCEENSGQGEESERNQVRFHSSRKRIGECDWPCLLSTAPLDFLVQPTEDRREHESKMMKIHYFAVGLVAVGGMFFSGCATDTTTTTQTRTDPSKRVYSQEELRKSGETDPGSALEKTDPSVRMSGPR
jgi:hypothetical protein